MDRTGKLLGRLVVLSFIFGFVWLGSTRAEASLSLAVSPPKLDLGQVDPGSALSGAIVLINPNQAGLHLKVEAKDLLAAGNQGTIKPSETADRLGSLKDWLTLPTEEIYLEPEEKMTFELEIAVPADAEPGGHYAGLYFRTVPQHGQVKVGLEIGVIVNLVVAGEIWQKGELVEFKPASTLFWGSQPHLTLTVKNSGNVHLLPQGTIEFRDFSGRILNSLPLPKRQIFPSTVRVYDLDWESQPKLGFFEAEIRLTGLGGETQTARAGFLILPKPFLILPFLIGLGIITRFWRRKFGLWWVFLSLLSLVPIKVQAASAGAIPVKVEIKLPQSTDQPYLLPEWLENEAQVLGVKTLPATQPALPTQSPNLIWGESGLDPPAFPSADLNSWRQEVGLVLIGGGLVLAVGLFLIKVRSWWLGFKSRS